jgi:GT2 family glycosyltransferase
MKSITAFFARESQRKIHFRGRPRAYWGPLGLLRLLMRAAQVTWSEGAGSVFRGLVQNVARAFGGIGYETWATRFDRLTDSDRLRMVDEIAKLSYRPLVSIIMAVRNTSEQRLRDALDSVVAQLYPDWELCVAHDASTQPHLKPLLEQYIARDSRIKVALHETNGQISVASNSALSAARGEFVTFMGHDDLIPAHALFEFVKRLNDDPLLDMVYSDEDKVDGQGRRYDPIFKPDWSPDYLESMMYTANLTLYRKALVDRIGGISSECEGAQDYDLALRVTELTDRIGHIPEVLFHRRAVAMPATSATIHEDIAVTASIRALEGRLRRTGRAGTVTMSRHSGCFAVRASLPRTPLVSIVIPTAGQSRKIEGKSICLVDNCVRRIRQMSTYRNFEIVIVDDVNLPEALARSLDSQGCSRVTYTEPRFNFSKMVNLGSARAKGEFLLLLNDDTEVITPDWIERMLEQALKPNVGAVGAKLLYPDDTLQHVGVVHCKGLPVHVRYGFPREDTGYMYSTVSVRNYLAVTAACMLTRADLYWQVGGFSDEYAVNFNDIDYCLRLRARGWRTVYTPDAELYHLESATRKSRVSRKEQNLFLQRWSSVTARDPYYNADYFWIAPPDFTLWLRRPRRARVTRSAAS